MTLSDAAIAFFRDATLTREEIDRFLDPGAPSWARFDGQLGYLPNESDVPDNIDGAMSEYRYGPLGERRRINHSADPCRLNTYGDSFTQCHQVSDGETWQEVLAAHLHEPVRNFGVGGFGVHQAVTRLRRVEAGPGSAPFVILNIYLDDHYRSIDAYRLLRLGRWWRDYDRSLTTSMFHANPWEHVRLDAATGELIVRPNLCPSPESLYDLCDTDACQAYGGATAEYRTSDTAVLKTARIVLTYHRDAALAMYSASVLIGLSPRTASTIGTSAIRLIAVSSDGSNGRFG